MPYAPIPWFSIVLRIDDKCKAFERATVITQSSENTVPRQNVFLVAYNNGPQRVCSSFLGYKYTD